MAYQEARMAVAKIVQAGLRFTLRPGLLHGYLTSVLISQPHGVWVRPVFKPTASPQ